MVVINHQRRTKQIESPNGYQADHIIPYCLTADDSLNNIQIIKQSDHRKKTIIDHKIIKEFRKLGWIDKISNYSHELLKPQEFLVEEYKIRFKKYWEAQYGN